MLKCPKCKKCFDFKQQYERHIAQRTNCVHDLQIMEYQPIKNPNIHCSFCFKQFEKTRELERHLESKKNSCYIKRIEDEAGKVINIKKMVINDNSTKQNIQNNNIFKPPKIKPIKFRKRGKERVDHITKDVVLELFKNQKFILICEELMKLIYFNDAIPENRTWSIAYPKNDTAGIAYNHEDDEFERKETKEIVEDKFSNMINLLVPVMQSIHKDAEFYETLSDMQQVNMVRFFYHLGMYHISKESPDVYEAMHKLCYDQRRITMKFWGEQGYSGSHLSLKFA